MPPPYNPIYIEPGTTEQPLKDYYTFIGAGFYNKTPPTNDGEIVFKWDNLAAWKEILYRHLYTAEQRDLLCAYVQLVASINSATDAVKTNINSTDNMVKRQIKDGRFTHNGVEYCVRNMYIYRKETVDGWLGICALHIKLRHLDTIMQFIDDLCKNGGHTLCDVLTIMEYVSKYKPENLVNPPESEGDIHYIFIVNGDTYTFPIKYAAVYDIIIKYFTILCTTVRSYDITSLNRPFISYPINTHGIINNTGICGVISALHLLSDMGIIVQECDAYDGADDMIIYMLKTFQEFRRDIIKSNADHYAYGQLYHIFESFVSWSKSAPGTKLPDISPGYKKAARTDDQLPTDSTGGSILYGYIINIVNHLATRLNHPMNLLGDFRENTSNGLCMHKLSPGTEQQWVDLVQPSHKYVILCRSDVHKQGINLPIRVYNKHTDSDYVLLSYIHTIHRHEGSHAVYVNMETRNRVCNGKTADGPSAMHAYTPDDVGTIGPFMNMPEYTHQSLAHATFVLYCLDDGISQCI